MEYDVLQVVTFIKYLLADGCYSIGDVQANQSIAIFEGLLLYACHSIGECYGRKLKALIKSHLAYGVELAALLEDNLLQILALGESTQILDIGRDGDFGHTGALGEGVIIYGSDGGRQVHLCQGEALCKSPIGNACQCAGQCQVDK